MGTDKVLVGETVAWVQQTGLDQLATRVICVAVWFKEYELKQLEIEAERCSLRVVAAEELSTACKNGW
jgi:hypothetical protein